MKLILLGPPGAGKGTQATFICRDYAIAQISTGEMLRTAIAAGTPLGRKVQAIMDAGELVDDDTVVRLVKERIRQPDCRNGFLFDGFPRTIPQAEAVRSAGIAIDHVVEIHVPDEVVVQRLSGRRVHEASGRIYHLEFDPPKSPGIDDDTGEPLIQRDDDNEHTVRERLQVYHRQTRPLVYFYRQLRAAEALRHTDVDGKASVDEIRRTIADALASQPRNANAQSRAG